ncbi:MAG TPA: hypothetical protein VGK99_18785 [Acidobacteriota bacterium]|jgi:hypothetical protein
MATVVTFRNRLVEKETISETQCCICGRKIEAKSIKEVRPTGTEGAMQTWHYCGSCWHQMRELRARDNVAELRSGSQSTLGNAVLSTVDAD